MIDALKTILVAVESKKHQSDRHAKKIKRIENTHSKKTDELNATIDHLNQVRESQESKNQEVIDTLKRDFQAQCEQYEHQLQLKGDEIVFLKEQLNAFRDALQSFQSVSQLQSALNAADIAKLGN